jgi:hypothetical protein
MYFPEVAPENVWIVRRGAAGLPKIGCAMARITKRVVKKCMTKEVGRKSLRIVQCLGKISGTFILSNPC